MCAVLIGQGTYVSIPSIFPDGGFVSINFGVDPQMQRLYELGNFQPYDTYTQRQRSFSLTAYGKRENGTGGSTQLNVEPSVTCASPTPIVIDVTPASCGYTIVPFSGDYYPSSYSYTKENLGWGQESWSFVTEPIFDIPYAGTVLFIRGIATGQVSTGAGQLDPVDQGIVYDTAASQDSNGDFIDGESGSVAAGFPGLGQFNIQRELVVTYVGGSVGKSDGYAGAANVTIPMQTIYV
ncbi:MAG: hypothetical protein KAS32_05415 [Candidatus Peribacteraceae bacterium]|nr:hypothetical protein [Candidatus Peribacteraceae bacterium]